MSHSISVNNIGGTLASHLARNQDLLDATLARLSSGDRITRPSDDARGLGITEKVSAQLLRNKAASTNVQNAISFVQASDGFMSTIAKSLTRMSELATLASNPMQNDNDRALYQSEFDALQKQLRAAIGGTTTEIGGTTDVNEPIARFNGHVLFGGGNGVQVNLGISGDQTLTIDSINLRQGAVGSVITQDSSGEFNLDVTDPTAVATLNAALTQIGQARATRGAVETRLSVVSASLTTEYEDLTAVRSRIRDTDVAAETTRMNRLNLISETATAMLSQANQSPNAVLRLLE